MSRLSALMTACRPAPGAARMLACALAMAMVAPPVAAAMYKWVDDKGVVHYTDKIPPEAVNRGTVEITKDGVPVRKIDPALTPEQIRARQQEEERKQVVTRQQEEAARKDRALLSSYASESEIDLARDRTLRTIDAAIQSSLAYSEQLARRKNEADQKIASFKGKPAPAVLERESETLGEELAKQSELVNAKRSERAAVSAKYDADKARYRELVTRLAAQNGELPMASAPTPTSTLGPQTPKTGSAAGSSTPGK